MLDNKTIVNNIIFLAERKKIKIGVLEKAANCSVGYLSRVSSGDIVAVPPVEKLEAIANMLEISIDTLINIDIQGATPNELFVCEFIYRVKSQTRKSNIEWAEEEIERITLNNDNKAESNFDNELFAYKSNDLFKDDIFNSSFMYDAELSGYMFKTIKPITPQIVICKMSYKRFIDKIKESSKNFEDNNRDVKRYLNVIELYLKEPHSELKEICSSILVNRNISKELNELYDLINEIVNKLRLNEETKNGMMNFLDVVYDEKSRNEAFNSQQENRTVNVKHGLGKSFKRIFGEGDENNE